MKILCRLFLVKNLVKKGIEKDELIEAEPEVLASELFSLACGNLYYKKDNVIDIEKLYKEIDKTFIQFLKKQYGGKGMRLNFKIPNMKFKKIKMDGDEIMKEIDVEKLKKEAEKNEC